MSVRLCSGFRPPSVAELSFAILALLTIGLQPATSATSRRLLLNTSSEDAHSAISNVRRSAEYLDGLFSNLGTARSRLAGQFQKKSTVAVVYTCFERSDMIRQTLSAVLASEDISRLDLIVSQDGGSNYTFDVKLPASVNSLVIKHPANLCTGLHHYFVKRFAFEVMAYDTLVVVEEDNRVHPQAIRMLLDMIAIAGSDPEVGVVTVTDMDNSLLFDEARYGAAILRVDVHIGHLWVYAVQATRYHAVKEYLTDYYEVIKGHDYRNKDMPPLRDGLQKLLVTRGMSPQIPLSQDAFFLHALEKEGYSRRLTTLVRLFEPLGWDGLHFRQDANSFYSLYGKGMYEGRVEESAFEITKDPDELAELERDCRFRMNQVYTQYLGRNVDKGAADKAVLHLLLGRMNAVEMVRDIVNSAEHRRRMKELLLGKPKNA